MTRTTPAGIEIRLCGRCGYEHPVTRRHCITCDCPSLFIDPDTNLCVQCGQLPKQTDIFQQLEEIQ